MSDYAEIPELPQFDEIPGVLLDAGTSAIRPGDTAVFSADQRLTSDQLARIRDDLAAKLPGVTVMVISQVRFEATYRPDSTAVEVNEAQQ